MAPSLHRQISITTAISYWFLGRALALFQVQQFYNKNTVWRHSQEIVT